MTNKSHKATVFALLLLTLPSTSQVANASTDRFSASLLGKCFNSGKDFVRHQFHCLPMESNCTVDDRENDRCEMPDSVDENIQLVPNKGVDKYGLAWVIDKTPGGAPDRYLLHKESNNKFCLMLFVPSSSEFSLMKSDKRGFPLLYSAGVSPLQGLPGWEVDFKYNQILKVFEAKNCKRVDADTNGVITKMTNVSCDSVYK